MTSVIAMDYFQEKFHTGTTGTQVAIIFSLYTVLVNPLDRDLYLSLADAESHSAADPWSAPPLQPFSLTGSADARACSGGAWSSSSGW